MSKHIVTARRGLGFLMVSMLLLAFVCILPTTKAMAASTGDGSTGELIILPTDANSGVEYRVYRIFDGQTDSNGAMSGLSWANNTVSQVVRDAIHAEDSSFSDTSAEDSAEFIVSAFGETALGTTIVDSSSFAWHLAMAIDGSNATHTSLSPSQTGSLPAGYYLVMTDAESFDGVKGETGTAPIFAVVSSGKRTQVGEKTNSPTITKQVKECDVQTWGKRTVAGTGEDVEFMSTITLPSNYAAFATYKIEIVDNMENMTIKSTSDVRLYADNVTVNGAKVAYDPKGTLTVTIDDLKQMVPTATKDTVLALKYIVQLMPGANMGAKGNVNTVEMRYTRSPNSTGLGETPISSATVYSWGLKILKVEANKHDNKLSGANFVIGFVRKATSQENLPKVEDYDGYVTADGTMSHDAYTFTTDSKGLITVPNIPAGTYVVSETKAPEGYTGISDRFAVMFVNKRAQGSVTDPYDLATTIIGSREKITMDANGSANLGFVSVTVENDKDSVPPVPSVPNDTPSDTPTDTPTKTQSNDLANDQVNQPAISPTSVTKVLSDLVHTGQGRAILGSIVAAVTIGAFVAYTMLKRKSDRKDDADSE